MKPIILIIPYRATQLESISYDILYNKYQLYLVKGYL